jgi:hypothetical protein
MSEALDELAGLLARHSNAVLNRAIAAAQSEYITDDHRDSDWSTAYNRGVTDAIAAIEALKTTPPAVTATRTECGTCRHPRKWHGEGGCYADTCTCQLGGPAPTRPPVTEEYWCGSGADHAPHVHGMNRSMNCLGVSGDVYGGPVTDPVTPPCTGCGHSVHGRRVCLKPIDAPVLSWCPCKGTAITDPCTLSGHTPYGPGTCAVTPEPDAEDGWQR